MLKTDERGTPVLVRDVGRVSLGPEIRRGVADLDGMGDAVGGIVVMRHGENAREVIRRVKERLRELEPVVPRGGARRPHLRPLDAHPARRSTTSRRSSSTRS